MTTDTARFGQAVSPGHVTAPYRWLRQVRESWSRYWDYVETVAELEALSDRELADIGMERLALRRAALEATQNK